MERLAMDLQLSKRSAVVLASSGGLGRAVAEALLAEGATVAISGRDPERLAATRAALEAEHGERVLAEAFDVADREALARHLEGVRRRAGRRGHPGHQRRRSAARRLPGGDATRASTAPGT